MVYVVECFQNQTLFHKALEEAFEIFCNKRVAGSSSAELLATFCDNILKNGGSEELSDEAIEDTLEKVWSFVKMVVIFIFSVPLESMFNYIMLSHVVKLLAYISDKDLFAEFYRKKLARTLLFDRSANDDHERSIFTKLKQQCGRQFTSKMEDMVTDLTLARENQTSFEEYLDNNPAANPGIDLTVTVLTTGFWPSYKSFDINLPSEMIPLPPVDERKEVVEDVDKDRRYAIDAAIVRIMKSRKVLGYQQLVSECVEQLSRMFKSEKDQRNIET
ncbi:hypothetical protein Bca101_018987 [Brassica carinata]